MDKVNIREALDSVTEHWSQKIIGEANGQLFKVAKGEGEIRLHKHDDQDELFIVQQIKRQLQIIFLQQSIHPVKIILMGDSAKLSLATLLREQTQISTQIADSLPGDLLPTSSLIMAYGLAMWQFQ